MYKLIGQDFLTNLALILEIRIVHTTLRLSLYHIVRYPILQTFKMDVLHRPWTFTQRYQRILNRITALETNTARLLLTHHRSIYRWLLIGPDLQMLSPIRVLHCPMLLFPFIQNHLFDLQLDLADLHYISLFNQLILIDDLPDILLLFSIIHRSKHNLPVPPFR